VLQLSYDLSNLVDTLPCVIGVAILIFSAEVPPLEAIYRSEITLFAICEA
jgi:hypothetical protein